MNDYVRKRFFNEIKNLKFKTKKSLGQNFLRDQNMCDQIAEMAFENANQGVIEIGTGFGILTYSLAKKFKVVASVEIDNDLFDFAEKNFSSFSSVNIIHGDALKIDVNDLINKYFTKCEELVLCANIPYYITTPIIMKFLECEKMHKMVVMVQKEVADRILAPPGTKNCGSISVAVRYYSNPGFGFHVDKSHFVPSPKVDSSVIYFETFKRSDVISKKLFFKVLKSAFSERRKNILNSISSGLKIDKSIMINILSYCNLDKNLRAENLKFDDFVRISNKLFQFVY